MQYLHNLPPKFEKGASRKDPEAMRNLMALVGSKGKKDIKMVRKATTLEGAQAYAAKHKKWRADSQDLDGDGVKEIVVYDVNGTPVVINGYSLDKSSFPERAMYYGLDKETRKQYAGYKDYLTNAYYQPEFTVGGGEATGYKGKNPKTDPWTQSMKAAGYKIHAPKKQSAYQWFNMNIVKPQVEAYVAEYNSEHPNAPIKKNFFLKACQYVWYDMVMLPVLEALGHVNGNAEGVQLFNYLTRGGSDDKEFMKNLKRIQRQQAYTDAVQERIEYIHNLPADKQNEYTQYIYENIKKAYNDYVNPPPMMYAAPHSEPSTQDNSE